jgi:NADH-quinone oxidoreductase subunit K
MVPLSWYVVLSALLFLIGVAGMLFRRNILVVLMCLELILNAVNLNLVAFSYFLQDLNGQMFAIFVITVTACEVAIALAILVTLLRNRTSLRVDDITLMRG